MTKIVFIDTETTSLRHDRRAWEIALIVRDNVAGGGPGADQEYRWFIDLDDLDLANADPKSLQIGRFYERHSQASGEPPQWTEHDDPDYLKPWPERMVMRDLEREFLRGATIVAAIPGFDMETIANRMRAHGLLPSWDHHLVDVESFAAGARRRRPPWKLNDFLDAYGIKVPDYDRHTALGDARAVRDLYDVVMRGAERV